MRATPFVTVFSFLLWQETIKNELEFGQELLNLKIFIKAWRMKTKNPMF